MTVTQFTYQDDDLKQITSDVLRMAKQKGATHGMASVSESLGLSVSVRSGELETIEKHQDKGLSVTVYVGKKRGNASTSDFSKQALEQAVDAAYNIACYTEQDDAAGLPDIQCLEHSPKELNLFHPWDINALQAKEIAQKCEAAAFETDKRITNSDGANVNAYQAHFITASSDGFVGGYPYSSHSLSLVAIAQNDEDMQRDYWHSKARNSQLLKDPVVVGRLAAQRALARLNAKPLETQKCPVLFEAPVAKSLIASLVAAVSGGILYRKASFLQDSLDKQIFPSHISLHENPHIKGALGSAPFDDEGVQTKARSIIDKGILTGYFLSSYTARKLGMQTTGNAGGAHNLRLVSSNTTPIDSFENMVKKMHRGLVVTDLLGRGVNYTNGDYSRGASGFWVENGVICYPVQEITIAGNLRDMFLQILAVGDDVDENGTISTGSILVDNMTVAGV